VVDVHRQSWGPLDSETSRDTRSGQVVDPGLQYRVARAGCRTELAGLLVAPDGVVQLEQVDSRPQAMSSSNSSIHSAAADS
jgi:hypothetical protein